MTKPFVPNPIGIAALGKTEAMEQMLKEKAEQAAIEAQSQAPVLTGCYRDGIKAEAGLTEEGKLVGRVNAHDQKSSWIQFGSVHNTARHILANAVEAIGLKLLQGASDEGIPPLAQSRVERVRCRHASRRSRVSDASTGRSRSASLDTIFAERALATSPSEMRPTYERWVRAGRRRPTDQGVGVPGSS